LAEQNLTFIPGCEGCKKTCHWNGTGKAANDLPETRQRYGCNTVTIEEKYNAKLQKEAEKRQQEEEAKKPKKVEPKPPVRKPYQNNPIRTLKNVFGKKD
jgi:hypothetical protein